MSLRRPAKNQPENFEFNNSSLEAANKIMKLPENWLIEFAEQIKQTGFFVRISA